MIVLTGATGFLGRHVLARLSAAGSRARCLVRPGTGVDRLPEQIRRSAEIHEVSFNDERGLVRALAGATCVYHVAALTYGSPSAMVASTVSGSDRLFRAAMEGGAGRVVLVSSIAVLAFAGLRAGACVTEAVPLDEHPERRDGYTFAKHRQEALAWRYHSEHGLPLVVVRPGVIFGEDRSPLTPRVGLRMGGLFLCLGARNPVPLVEVGNCADAVVRAGTTPGVEGSAFCLVDDDLPLGRHVLRACRAELRGARVVRVPYRLLHALARAAEHVRVRYRRDVTFWTPHHVASTWRPFRFANDAAKARLGWRPATRMNRALRRDDGLENGLPSDHTPDRCH